MPVRTPRSSGPAKAQPIWAAPGRRDAVDAPRLTPAAAARPVAMATDGYVSHQQQKWETYLAEHQVEKIFRDLTSDLITRQPQDSIQHMIEWLHKFREAKTKPKKKDSS